MDPDQIKAAVEALKNNDAAAALTILEAWIISAAVDADDAPTVATDPPPDPSAPPADPKTPPPGTASALAKSLGVTSDLEVVKLFRGMQVQIDALSEERDASDLEARRELIAGFVTLGVETPATAWQGDAKDRKPVKRLLSESLSEMKARFAALSAANPNPGNLRPRAEFSVDVSTLSKAELAACAKRGMSPEEYVAAKASAVRRIA